jgi:hypothetical protein
MRTETYTEERWKRKLLFIRPKLEGRRKRESDEHKTKKQEIRVRLKNNTVEILSFQYYNI